MGQSTDAHLFYGYCWSEEGTELFRGDCILYPGDNPDDCTEHDHEEVDDGEWTEVVLARRGIFSPWTKIPADLNSYDSSSTRYSSYKEQQELSNAWTVEHRAEIDSYYQAKKDVEEEYGVAISSHCSCDYPMPYIHVKGTEQQAWRGSPQTIDVMSIAKLDVSAMNRELSRFVADLGIDLSEAEGPAWFLVSMWC